jgi:hypothetical protein
VTRGFSQKPLVVLAYIYLLFFSMISTTIAISLMVLFLVWLSTNGILTYAQKVLVLVLVSLSLVFNIYNFDPISGVDEQAFFDNLQNFNLYELLRNELTRFLIVGGFVSSRITFSALLSFLLPFPGFSENAFVIVIVNAFFWFLSCKSYLLSLKSNGYLKDVKLALIFLMSSPTLLYWMGNFGKDVIVISICLLSAAAYINKKYILFLIFLLVALTLRPYSVVVIGCFVFPFCFSYKKIFLLMTFVFVVFFVGTKFSIIPFINSFIGFIYLFLSPNPFNLSNWSILNETNDFLFSPIIMVVESLFISLVIFYGMIVKRRWSDKLFKSMIAIYCLSICLVGVGYINSDSNNVVLSVGNLGDNFIRKKLIVWPLIAIMLSLMFSKGKIRT